MEKLLKANNETYMLMQDIVKSVGSFTNSNSLSEYNPCDWINVSIPLNHLIFFPTSNQLEKALVELQFLFSGWVKRDNLNKELLSFIDKICFTDEILLFEIPVLILSQLRNTDYNLNKYIEIYVD